MGSSSSKKKKQWKSPAYEAIETKYGTHADDPLYSRQDRRRNLHEGTVNPVYAKKKKRLSWLCW